MALGIFDMTWPPYAADITLELHEHRQTNEAFVKVSYIGQVGCVYVHWISCGIFPLLFHSKLLVFL